MAFVVDGQKKSRFVIDDNETPGRFKVDEQTGGESGFKRGMKEQVAPYETTASLLTSMASWIPAGLYAAGQYVVPPGLKSVGLPRKTPEKIAEDVETISGALTYKPKTKQARETMGIISKPFESLHKTAPKVGSAVSESAKSIPFVGEYVAPVAGAMAHTMVEGAPFILPAMVKGMLPTRGMKPEIKPEFEPIKDVLPFERAPETTLPTPIEAAMHQRYRIGGKVPLEKAPEIKLGVEDIDYAVHYAKTPRETFRGSGGEIKPNQFSKEIKTRIENATEEYPHIPEVNAYAPGATPEHLVKQGREAYRIDLKPGEVYDSVTDPLGLWKKAKEIYEKTPGVAPSYKRTVFANLAQKEGFGGYSAKTGKGEKWVFLFGERKGVPMEKPTPTKAVPMGRQEPYLMAGQRGELELPKFREVKRGMVGVLQNIYDTLDVQAPFNRSGTPETGIWIKNYPSLRITEQNHALDFSKKLGKLKIDPEEGAVVTMASSAPRKPLEVVGLKTDKITKAAQETRKYFEDAYQRHKAEGTLSTRWPKSQYNRNVEKIKAFQEHIESTTSETAKEWYKNEIEELGRVNKEIETIDPQYVHAPVGYWFDKIEASLGTAEAAKITRVTFQRFFRQRELVDMPKLIDYLKTLKDADGNLIFKPQDFDIRTIVAHYAQKSGKILGLAKIVKAARKEGLVVKGGKQPDGYGLAPPELRAQIPDLRGAWIHNMFLDYMQNFIQQIGPAGVRLGRVFGYTKILQFYNPAFLPIYDLWQGTWLGAMRSPKAPIWLGKGVKSVWNRDAAYYEAAEHGAFSTPYAPPFENFMKDMMASSEYRILHKVLNRAKKYPGVFPALDDFMRGVWHLAWKGDQSVRMASYHYLIKKGFKPIDAAQVTAHFHGDYARLRPNVRRIANKIFFTPTFKYAMAHAQANMVKSTVKTVGSLSKGKLPTPKDLLYAKALLALVGGMMARDVLMTRFLGFKRDTLGLRYTKIVQTDQGEKEVVVYQATPDNVIPRQIFKWTTWGDDPDRMEAFFEKAKWDLHPLWRLSLELWKNKKPDGNPIRNPFDDEHKQAKDVLLHATKTIVAVVGAIEKRIDAGEGLSPYTELRKDLGYTWGAFLEASSLAYLRNPPDKRTAWKIKQLDELYRKYFREDEPKDEQEAMERLSNFHKKLDELMKGAE